MSPDAQTPSAGARPGAPEGAAAGGPTRGIGGRTLRGMMWAYGSYVGGRLLVLVATAVLARLLTPEEFGLVALALIFTGLLDTVKDLGVTQALIVVPASEETERAETVFAISVGLGITLTLAAVALSPLAANFFDEPELVGLLSLLGLNFFLRSLGATHYALAQKRMDFRVRTIAELSDVVLRGGVGIGLAFAGAGAWTLVIGYLVGTLAMTCALWILVRWRPRLRPKREHMRQLVGFGGTLTGIDIVGSFIANIDYIFVGKILGPATLGLYTLAFRLPELLVRNLGVVAAQVLYPAFAAVERGALDHAFLVSVRYTLMVTLPFAVALGVLAEPFVLAAFGDQWTGAIEAMRVLAVYALISTLAIPAGTAYKATGRAGVLLMLAIPRAVLLVVTLALFTDDGIVAVAWCQAGGTTLLALANTVMASRLLGVQMRRMCAAVWPPVAAGAAMAGVLYFLEGAIDSPWPALLAGGAAGVLVYVGTLWLLARETLVDLLTKAMPDRFGRAQEVVSPETGSGGTEPPRAVP
jgi:lipopolysaccharide exporter